MNPETRLYFVEVFTLHSMSRSNEPRRLITWVKAERNRNAYTHSIGT